MELSQAEAARAAHLLDTAMRERREVERLTGAHPGLSLADAYRIQDEGIRLRIARGERVIGFKMGLTSEAKRRQMDLDSPVYGVLTDAMRIRGQAWTLRESIHPKIEPEVAFVLERDLKGKVTRDQALDACSGVCAALEILDSRYRGFKYFSLPDVVADNSSSSRFVLGDTLRAPRELDLMTLRMELAVTPRAGGAPVREAALSEAISGDPVQSLVQLCELLASRGLGVPAGSIVLAGAATPAIALSADCAARLTVDGLGEVSLEVRA